jgi:hypothetical protein
MDILKVGDETITAADFVKWLKLTNKFEDLVIELVNQKVMVHGSKKYGVSVDTAEIQERFDDVRRVAGLHRAEDTQAWLKEQRISLDEMEKFVAEEIARDKLMEQIITEAAVEEYFKLNSPKFQTVEARHILADNLDKAKEIKELLEDDLDQFADLCMEHSLDGDTKAKGGAMGAVRRGTLPDEIDAKIFNAAVGDVVGPIELQEGVLYDIIVVDKVIDPKLTPEVTGEIAKALQEEWLDKAGKEVAVEYK